MTPGPVDGRAGADSSPTDDTAGADRRLRRLKLAAYFVLGLGFLAFVVQGANSPADPSFVGQGDKGGRAEDGPDALSDFGEVAITVAPSDGSGVLEWCLLLAATEVQRQRGLMEVTDPALGGYDGMLFRYDQDVSVPFYMRNTPMPLSIAYIDASGRIVSSTDMAPCPDAEGCPTYPPAGPYRWALEVPQGGLGRLGVVGEAVFTDTGGTCLP